jgi:hypothetical protein
VARGLRCRCGSWCGKGGGTVGRVAAGPRRPGASGDPSVVERAPLPEVEGGAAGVHQRR